MRLAVAQGELQQVKGQLSSSAAEVERLTGELASARSEAQGLQAQVASLVQKVCRGGRCGGLRGGGQRWDEIHGMG